MKSKKSYKGVTLIEVMIVIAIAAILLAVAAPSFRELIVRSNINSLVDDFAATVITARTEALSRGREVRVCAKSDCTAGSWAGGWFIVDAAGARIQEFVNDSGYPISLTAGASAAVNSITFNAAGYNRDQLGYVFLVSTPSSISPEVSRRVTVAISGQVYVED